MTTLLRWRALPFGLLLILAACGRQEKTVLQGYAEGEYVRVAAPLAGSLAHLAVRRGAEVKLGDPLFTLEQDNERAARDEAVQRLRAAEAQLANVRKGRRPTELAAIEAQIRAAQAASALSDTQLRRNEALFASGHVPRENLDEARSGQQRAQAQVTELQAQLQTARLAARSDEIAAAQAAVEAARAALAQAAWRVTQKGVTAPVAGRVDDTLYTPGEWVAAGNPVVSLLPPTNIKLRFFVPEPLLGKVHLGQAVTVACDGCGGALAATINYISSQAEYTPPVIYSRETRSKLVYMIEAQPTPADAIKLHPGQPLDVTLRSP